MAVNGPQTGLTVRDPNTGNPQDLGNRYVSKDYLLDVYPNLVPGRTVPGLWCWGLNAYGQLGLGTTLLYSSPVQVGSLTNWRQVSAGIDQETAIKTNGTLWCWGLNTYGQLGNGTTTSYSSPIQVGSLTNWKQVSVGEFYNAASKTDGTLWAWGYNNHGQLGNGTTTSYSSPIQVGSLTNWKQITAGNFHTAAIQIDGSLWTWGYNAQGQLGNNNSGTDYSSPIQVGYLTNWKQVAVGEFYNAAIKTDGTLWTWGYNNYGQLGNGTTTSYSSPIQVGSLTNWKQVSCGYNGFTTAVKNDGTLWAWGYNANGQLGNGTVTSYSSPIQVGSLTNWKQVSCGYNGFTTAVKNDGTLWAWGYNANGQLGNGTVTSYSSPIQVGSLTNWRQVACGTYFTAAISDGYI